MNGQTHLLGGLTAGLLVATLVPVSQVPWLLGAAALAGPLADIDHPGSMYGRWLPLPGVAKVYGHIEPYTGGPFCTSSGSFGHVGRRTPFGTLWHRGPTHSLFVAMAASALAAVAFRGMHHGEAVAIGVLAGYLSHLALDLLNVSGQQLLWPFSKRHIALRWPKMHVGSLGETFIAMVLAAFALMLGTHFVLIARVTALR